MKIRFMFEIDRHESEDVELCDFDTCDTIEDLEAALLDSASPHWHVSVDRGDLEMLWASIQELRK
jgi:hypothetical protein